jgi:hypothetical protein
MSCNIGTKLEGDCIGGRKREREKEKYLAVEKQSNRSPPPYGGCRPHNRPLAQTNIRGITSEVVRGVAPQIWTAYRPPDIDKHQGHSKCEQEEG